MTTLTPSLRSRLLVALKPFINEALRYYPPEGDDRQPAFETDLTIGEVRRFAALYHELKSLESEGGEK